jgi:FixJ family two-component response regulator
MRRMRAVIIDDEHFVSNMLKDLLSLRGYEVLLYSDAAMVCPLLGVEGDRCTYDIPCTDVLFTNFNMPGLNGVEVLQHHQLKGCRLNVRNKAVIFGYLDDLSRRALDSMGCMSFQKPITVTELSDWLDDCERRIDLSQPLATRRREDRFESHRELTVRIARSDQVLSAATVNVSQSGLCLRVPAPLKHSDILYIDDSDFTNCRRASVRWVRPAGSDVFIAGLQCIS